MAKIEFGIATIIRLAPLRLAAATKWVQLDPDIVSMTNLVQLDPNKIWFKMRSRLDTNLALGSPWDPEGVSMAHRWIAEINILGFLCKN